jgi:hypothetical protein
MEGEYVSHAFQVMRNHGRNKDEPSLYQKYGTWGGCGAIISLIINPEGHFSFYLIAIHIMCKYTKE